MYNDGKTSLFHALLHLFMIVIVEDGRIFWDSWS